MSERSQLVAGEGAPPEVTTHRKRRGIRTHLLLLAILVLILIMVGAGSVVALAGLHTERQLTDARRSLDAGRRALLLGKTQESELAFSQAQRRFQGGERAAAGGFGRIASMVPFLGRNLDVAAGIARAGSQLAGAGANLSAAIKALPGGLDSLTPTQGHLPLTTLAGLADDVDRADVLARNALEQVRATPSSMLFGKVADTRLQVELEVGDIADRLDSTAVLLRGLSTFAGAQSPQRYLFIASNPAELRGTGGLWGAYSIATMNEGKLSFGPFKPIESLRNLPPASVPDPNPDFRRNYNQYGGAGYWLNMNMTPDFPSAARAALETYRLGEGERLDGLIAADPFVLQSLLRVTGPVLVPQLGIRLGADDVVPFITNQAYSLFGRSVIRKGLLGEVASGAFGKFLSIDGRGLPRLHALATAAAAGHLQIYDDDPTMERGLIGAGLGSGLAAPAGDLLLVSVNNASGTKVDYYSTRSVSYDVQLGGTGQAMATTDVHIRNDAPTRGQPAYVIGPQGGATKAGEQVSLVTLTCARRCELTDATRDGSPRGLRVGSELGFPWYQDDQTIGSSETSDLQVRTFTPGAWDGNSSGGTYRLTVLGQTTIRPTDTTITVHAPAGTRITWTSLPMQVNGGSATWKGETGPRLELEISFRAPLPLRLWRNLLRAVP